MRILPSALVTEMPRASNESFAFPVPFMVSCMLLVSLRRLPCRVSTETSISSVA